MDLIAEFRKKAQPVIDRTSTSMKLVVQGFYQWAVEQLESIIGDKIVILMSKEEAKCLLLACPYGENYAKKKPVPKARICPHECNVYQQLIEALEE